MKNVVLGDILVALTVIMIILTMIGGTMLLRFSYHGQTQNNLIMKYLLRHLSLSNLLVGVIAMPCNVFVLLCKDKTSCNIACLSRYFLTFIFSSHSLIILAILCHYRCDLIVKVPFGKEAYVTSNNRKRLIVISSLVSFLPNLALATGYLYMMIDSNTPPCRPDEKHKKTTHYYLGISEGFKTGALFGICFTSIIRNVSNIRKTLANQAKRVEQSAVRARQSAKVNANLYFAVVFIVMWIPFSLIAAFANYIPRDYYEDAFTLGYTLAYASFVLLPICYALTDSNFKTYLKNHFGINNRSSLTDSNRDSCNKNSVRPM